MEKFDYHVSYECFAKDMVEKFSNWDDPVEGIYLVPDPRYMLRYGYIIRM
jgi:hypothetical protein